MYATMIRNMIDIWKTFCFKFDEKLNDFRKFPHFFLGLFFN